MNFLSVFTGIGAFDLGLEAAGMTCVGQIELDGFCRAVLAKHWPGVFRWSDVCDLPTELVRYVCGRPDVICGGFACQDVSVAGKGKGIQRHTRSGLTWRNLFRLARGLRPAWLVIENVPALKNRGADRVLRALARIGYACWTFVVGAHAVGAPHKRDRVWIVCKLDDAAKTRCGGDSDIAQSIDRPAQQVQAEHHSAVRGDADESQQLANAHQNERRSSGNTGHQDWAIDAAFGAGDSTMADSQCVGLKKERRDINTELGLGSGGAHRCIFPGGCWRCELADAETIGRPSEGQRREPELAGVGSACADGTTDVADTDGARSETRIPGADQSRRQGLAEVAYDDCGGLRWPSRPGEPQHEWEAPRLLELGLGREFARFAEWMDGLDWLNPEEVTHGDGVDRKELPSLRKEVGAKAISENAGGSGGVQSQEVLQHVVHGATQEKASRHADAGAARVAIDPIEGSVRKMRLDDWAESASPERKPVRQPSGKHRDALRAVPHEAPLGEWQEDIEASGVLHRLREACRSQGALPETLVPVLKVWRSASNEQRQHVWKEVGSSIERRLRKQNKEALKAYGNTLIWIIPKLIGEFILAAEPERGRR
jgi:DNA (cytosine-5)-methyltransferase 1